MLDDFLWRTAAEDKSLIVRDTLSPAVLHSVAALIFTYVSIHVSLLFFFSSVVIFHAVS